MRTPNISELRFKVTLQIEDRNYWSIHEIYAKGGGPISASLDSRNAIAAHPAFDAWKTNHGILERVPDAVINTVREVDDEVRGSR